MAGEAIRPGSASGEAARRIRPASWAWSTALVVLSVFLTHGVNGFYEGIGTLRPGLPGWRSASGCEYWAGDEKDARTRARRRK
jgi:hypothetical protein